MLRLKFQINFCNKIESVIGIPSSLSRLIQVGIHLLSNFKQESLQDYQQEQQKADETMGHQDSQQDLGLRNRWIWLVERTGEANRVPVRILFVVWIAVHSGDRRSLECPVLISYQQQKQLSNSRIYSGSWVEYIHRLYRNIFNKMSEYQELQKNMIRCQAKIRTPEFVQGSENRLSQISSRLIRLPTPTLSQPLETNSPSGLQNYSQPSFSKDIDPPFATFSSLGLFQDEIDVSKMFNKLGNFQDNWSKVQGQDVESLFFKEDLAKRSQFAEFSQFQKTCCPSTFNQQDSDFDQSRILSSYLFQSSRLGPAPDPIKNYTYLQRALEDKNIEMVKILVSKNEEKGSLEKKIFDLEFQLFVQKRNSDRALNCVALELKNIEGICETQQIEIQRLQNQLKLSQEQREKSETNHQARVLTLLHSIRNLENGCLLLKREVEESHISIESIKKENSQLRVILEKNREQRESIENASMMKERLCSEFQNLLSLDIEEIESDLQSGSQSHNDMTGESESSIEGQVCYLQGLIKEYQKQLLDNKKKMREQKKSIIALQLKVQDLEGVCLSLEIASKMVADGNDQIMGLRLRELNSTFQFETL